MLRSSSITLEEMLEVESPQPSMSSTCKLIIPTKPLSRKRFFASAPAIELCKVLGIDQEAAGIQQMLSKPQAFEPATQPPSPRGVQLAITWLPEKHPGLNATTQQSQGICWKIQIFLSCGRPWRKAVEMSEVHSFQPRIDAREISIFLESLVVVGLLVTS